MNLGCQYERRSRHFSAPSLVFEHAQIQSGSAIFGSIITPRTTVFWTRATNRLLNKGRWSKKISRNSGDDLSSHIQAPQNLKLSEKSDTRRPERRRTFGKKKSGLGSPGGQSMPITQGGSIIGSCMAHLLRLTAPPPSCEDSQVRSRRKMINGGAREYASRFFCRVD